MLSSQALETGIGLALMMFVIAVAASNLLDLGRRMLNIRAKDLEVALMSFFQDEVEDVKERQRKGRSRLTGQVGGPSLNGLEQTAWEAFTKTSVYRGLQAARQQVRPAYLSAKAFADAVVEVAGTPAGPNADQAITLTGPLATRLEAASARAGGDLTKVRAELEGWFDEAMAGLSSRYKKKSSLWLFAIGFALAFALNASFPHVARDLWQDATTRAAVVAAAAQVPSPSASASPATVQDVARSTDQLTEIALPVGWPDGPAADQSRLGWWVLHILGFLLTGLLASLGGPFWYDIFNRLTLARSAKPPKASDDPTSATSAVAAVEP